MSRSHTLLVLVAIFATVSEGNCLSVLRRGRQRSQQKVLSSVVDDERVDAGRAVLETPDVERITRETELRATDGARPHGRGGRKLTGNVMRRLATGHHPLESVQACVEIALDGFSIALDFVATKSLSCSNPQKSTECSAAKDSGSCEAIMRGTGSCEAINHRESSHRKTCETLTEADCSDARLEDGTSNICRFKFEESSKACAWMDNTCIARCFMGIEGTFTGERSVGIFKKSLGVDAGVALSGHMAIATEEGIPCGVSYTAQKWMQSLKQLDGRCGVGRLFRSWWYNNEHAIFSSRGAKEAIFNSIVDAGSDLKIEQGSIEEMRPVNEITNVLLESEKTGESTSTRAAELTMMNPVANPLYLIGRTWSAKFFDPDNGLLAQWTNAVRAMQQRRSLVIEVPRRDPVNSDFVMSDWLESSDTTSIDVPRPICWDDDAADFKGRVPSRHSSGLATCAIEKKPGGKVERITGAITPKKKTPTVIRKVDIQALLESCTTPTAVAHLFHWFVRWMIETLPIQTLFLAKGGLPLDGHAEGKEYQLDDCESFPVKEAETIDSDFAKEEWGLYTKGAKREQTSRLRDLGASSWRAKGPYNSYTKPRLLCTLGKSSVKRRMCDRILFASLKDYKKWCDREPLTAARFRQTEKLEAEFRERFPYMYTIPLWTANVFPNLTKAIVDTDRKIMRILENGTSRETSKFEDARNAFYNLFTRITNDNLLRRHPIDTFGGSSGDAKLSEFVRNFASEENESALESYINKIKKDWKHRGGVSTSWKKKFYVMYRREAVALSERWEKAPQDMSWKSWAAVVRGRAFTVLMDYKKEIDNWAEQQSKKQAKHAADIKYPEVLFYEHDVAFGASIGNAEKAGTCSPDTNRIQVEYSRRYSGKFDPLGMGVGRRVSHTRADQLSLAGHPLPYLKVGGSFSQDRAHDRYDYEVEVTFFLLAVREDVDDDKIRKRGHAIEDQESSGILGDMDLEDIGLAEMTPANLEDIGLAEMTPAVRHMIIPFASSMLEKAKSFFDRVACTRKSKDMYDAAKSAASDIDVAVEGVGDAPEAAEDAPGTIRWCQRLERNGLRLVKTAGGFSMKHLLMQTFKEFGTKFQNYYTVSIVIKRDESGHILKPTFEVYVNYLSIFEITVPGTSMDSYGASLLLSRGIEWDITGAVAGGAYNLMKLPASGMCKRNDDASIERSGPAVCGLRALVSERGIQSDRCIMCTALASQLFSTSGTNIQSFDTFCRRGCENDQALCLDVGNRIELLVKTNRKKQGVVGAYYADTKVAFMNSGLKDRFLYDESCGSGHSEPEEAECAARLFCKTNIIGCTGEGA